jgi:hypothetical protein
VPGFAAIFSFTLKAAVAPPADAIIGESGKAVPGASAVLFTTEKSRKNGNASTER